MHEPIILDLKSRNFIWPSSYNTVAIVGDSNSQVLTFEVDAEYEGVDLRGTSCILSYWTSWTDDNDIHSAGTINLGTPKEIEKDGQTKLQYQWMFDLLQTARPGQCLFSIGFYLVLDDDFYYDNNDISKINFYTDETGAIRVVFDNIDIMVKDCYALKSNSGSFNIIDNGIKSQYEDIEFEGIEAELAAALTTANEAKKLQMRQNQSPTRPNQLQMKLN